MKRVIISLSALTLGVAVIFAGCYGDKKTSSATGNGSSVSSPAVSYAFAKPYSRTQAVLAEDDTSFQMAEVNLPASSSLYYARTGAESYTAGKEYVHTVATDNVVVEAAAVMVESYADSGDAESRFAAIRHQKSEVPVVPAEVMAAKTVVSEELPVRQARMLLVSAEEKVEVPVAEVNVDFLVADANISTVIANDGPELEFVPEASKALLPGDLNPCPVAEVIISSRGAYTANELEDDTAVVDLIAPEIGWVDSRQAEPLSR